MTCGFLSKRGYTELIDIIRLLEKGKFRVIADENEGDGTMQTGV